MEHPSVEHLVAACHLGDLGVPSAAHVFVAPFPCRLAAAGLVATGDVPESEESYVETTLVRRRAGEVRPIVSKTTRAETGEGIGADTYWHFDVCAHGTAKTRGSPPVPSCPSRRAPRVRRRG